MPGPWAALAFLFAFLPVLAFALTGAVPVFTPIDPLRHVVVPMVYACWFMLLAIWSEPKRREDEA